MVFPALVFKCSLAVASALPDVKEEVSQRVRVTVVSTAQGGFAASMVKPSAQCPAHGKRTGDCGGGDEAKVLPPPLQKPRLAWLSEARP